MPPVGVELTISAGERPHDHAPKVKPEAVVELLMMGMRMRETC
jgi:hypothetical protein